MKSKYYRLSFREWLYFKWEKLWKCKIKDQHHEKMQSWGKCYRCNKCINPPCY